MTEEAADSAGDTERAAPPKRRFHMTVDLHGDSWGDLIDGLADIGHEAFAEDRRSVTSGGSTRGWHYEIVANDEMTHDAYVEALEAWRKGR